MSKEYYNAYWQHEAPPERDPLSPIRLSLFFDHVQRIKPRSILDIGCGDGTLAARIQDQGFAVQGIDVSQTAICKAQRAFPHINFALISPDGSLPYASRQFDAIFCAEVIEHIYDTDQFIRELSRVLAVGGFFFITTPYHGYIKNLLLALFRFDTHFDVTGPHIRFFSDRSLGRLLRKHSLEPTFHHIGRSAPLWMDTIAFGTRI